MVNIFLCVIAAVLTLLIIAANVYILVYFQSEEDKNTAIFPKVVTVFTFTIIAIAILLLPMDKANKSSQRPNQTGIPMEILWKIVLITMACLAFIVPFAFFYYEAEDPDEKSAARQIKAALKWDLLWALFFFIPTFLLWLFIGYVEIPVVKYYAPLQSFTDGYPSVGGLSVLKGQLITYRISFLLYLISMITFAGTFFLIFFGGIGLSCLPMDLINGFRKRDKRMSVQVYAERRLLIGKSSGNLLEKGKALRDRIRKSGGTRPTNRKDVRDYNRFRTGVFILESEWKKLDKAYNKGLGPTILLIIWEWTQLVLGLAGIVISILWLIHIIVYMAPVRKPLSFFLNTMFIKMDNVFGLFGTLAYAIFSFYLLWCVIKGTFKVGVRIPLFCTIHPMKVGETLMNAFLFNAFVLLLACFAVVKFCSTAFAAYASSTAIDVIYNVGTNNIQYIKYFWRYYYWVMIALAILTTIYLFINPSDKKAVDPDEEEELPKW